MLSKWQNNTSCVYTNKALLSQLVISVSILYLCISARNCIFNVCVNRWKENTWKWIHTNKHTHIKQKINVKIKIEKKKKREKNVNSYSNGTEKNSSVYIQTFNTFVSLDWNTDESWESKKIIKSSNQNVISY